MNGGFSPLTGFMDETVSFLGFPHLHLNLVSPHLPTNPLTSPASLQTYKSVVENMALPSGLIMGLPVIFDTDDESLQPGDVALLKDGDREIATVEFTDKFLPDKPLECLNCYGTSQVRSSIIRPLYRPLFIFSRTLLRSSFASLVRSSTPVPSWSPLSVESTTWAERSPASTSPSATSSARPPRR